MTQIQHDNGEAYLRVPHSLDLRLTPYRHNDADAAALAEVSNDPEIARWSFSRPYPYTHEYATSWLDTHVPRQQAAVESLTSSASSAPAPAVTAQPFVVLRHEDKYVGDFWLVHESLPMGEWEKGDAWVLAYALLPEFWGKGVGTAAVKTVIEWAEETLGVREIVATIQTINTPSLRLAQKLGFSYHKTVMTEWPAHRGGGWREIQVWVWRSERSEPSSEV